MHPVPPDHTWGAAAATLATASALGAGLMAITPDEFQALVGIIAAVVGPILATLAGAIAYVFRAYQAEVRDRREVAERLARVVESNTVAASRSADILERIEERIVTLADRVTVLEDHTKGGRS